MHLVSVIVPTYNRRSLLEETIQSVLAQTCQDWEVVVVNDGSTDDTDAYLASLTDPRICVVHQVNSGRSAARNLGFEESSGRYVVFVDDDDLFLPERIDVQVVFLEEHPEIGMVASGFQYVDSSGSPIQNARPWKTAPNLDWRDCVENFGALNLSAVMSKRAVVEDLDVPFDREVEPFEDTDFFVRLVFGGCKMAWIENVVSCYRLHDLNTMGSLGGAAYREGVARMTNKWFARTDLPDEIRAERETIEARFDLLAACRAYAFNEIEPAQRMLRAALHVKPEWADDVFPKAVAVFAGGIAADPRPLIERVFRGLPPELTALTTLKKKAYLHFLEGTARAGAFDEGPLANGGVRASAVDEM